MLSLEVAADFLGLANNTVSNANSLTSVCTESCGYLTVQKVLRVLLTTVHKHPRTPYPIASPIHHLKSLHQQYVPVSQLICLLVVHQ